MIAGVLAGAIAANTILRQPDRYASRSILEIDQLRAVVAAGNAGPVDKLNQLRNKYALLAQTRRVTAPVAQKTGLPERLIAGQILVGTPGQSLLLIVTASAPDPSQARTIADGVAQELVALMKAEMDAASIPENDRIRLTVVAPAQRGALVEPKRSRAVTTGALAGVLAFIGVIAIAETARAYRRRP